MTDGEGPALAALASDKMVNGLFGQAEKVGNLNTAKSFDLVAGFVAEGVPKVGIGGRAALCARIVHRKFYRTFYYMRLVNGCNL